MPVACAPVPLPKLRRQRWRRTGRRRTATAAAAVRWALCATSPPSCQSKLIAVASLALDAHNRSQPASAESNRRPPLAATEATAKEVSLSVCDAASKERAHTHSGCNVAGDDSSGRRRGAQLSCPPKGPTNDGKSLPYRQILDSIRLTRNNSSTQPSIIN